MHTVRQAPGEKMLQHQVPERQQAERCGTETRNNKSFYQRHLEVSFLLVPVMKES